MALSPAVKEDQRSESIEFLRLDRLPNDNLNLDAGMAAVKRLLVHSIALFAIQAKIGSMWRIIWNGNTEHVEEHGLTVEDVEHVLANPESESNSRSSGLPCVFGYTPDGWYIIVVYEEVDPMTIYPVTAYEVDEP